MAFKWKDNGKIFMGEGDLSPDVRGGGTAAAAGRVGGGSARRGYCDRGTVS